MKTTLSITSVFVLIIGLYLLYTPAEMETSQTSTQEEEPDKAPDNYFYQQRAFPHGTINQKAFQQAHQQARAAIKANSRSSQGEWQQQGPFNVGGRVTDVAIHPTDHDIIYAGGSVGGVFKSTDAGESWTPVFDDAGNLSIGNIAIAKSNPDVVYVGTGEANGSATSGAFFGDGVYKSTNGGSSWESVGLEASNHVGRIIVDPTDEDRVFVAATGVLYGKNEERGLYRTMNGGQDWERIFYLNDSTACIDVAINPNNPNILYTVTWERIRYPWQRTYGGVNSRIYRSTDGGDNWQQLTNGLPDDDEDTGRIGIAICESQPNVLYASYTRNPITNTFFGLFKSVDGGTTWTRTNDGDLSSVFSSFGWFFGNVRVDPKNPDDVFVLGQSLYRSQDGGDSWEFATANMHVDFHGLEYANDDSDFIVIGNDGGLYISEDGGNVWDHKDVIPISQFYTAHVDFQNPERHYGGTQDNGTIRTLTGNTDDWERILGGDGFYVLVDPTDNQFVYAEFQFGNLRRSVDGGASFSNATNGIGDSDRNNWNTPVVLDPNNPSTLYYGTERLYRSVDRAASWIPISDDLSNGQHPSGSGSFATIITISVSPSNSDVIWVGTDDGNVQRTTDGGGDWLKVSDGLPERAVSRVAAHPTDEATAYATLSGYRNVDYQPHVFVTNDYGQSWTDISGNLPELPVNDIIIDTDLPSKLYVATDMGVWERTDAENNTWAPLGTGLPPSVVADLEFHQPTRTLIAGTFGRSMWDLQLEEPVNTQAPIAADNPLKIAPNPVVNQTQISWEMKESGQVELSLLDIQGRQVKSIASGDYPAGPQQIDLNIESQLAAGTYILRLESNRQIQTQRLLIQR
ncbi:MAG: T9SS type A sorting domain-containing protein [Bacteroidota bacterium]